MDRSDDEVGPSNELIPYGLMHYRDVALYPAANNPTHLKKKDIEGFHSEYHIPRGVYRLYMPEPTDRIYHTPPVPASHGDIAIGISESAFKCGFRVPLLRLYKKIFHQMKIAFGQMDPNGLIHINCFQYQCLAEGIHPLSRLFLFHYNFRRNAKSHGFYTIARRSGRSDWAATNSSNKKTHTHWCFISGPKLTEFGVWHVVDPHKLLMHELRPDEALSNDKLVRSEVRKSLC